MVSWGSSTWQHRKSKQSKRQMAMQLPKANYSALEYSASLISRIISNDDDDDDDDLQQQGQQEVSTGLLHAACPFLFLNLDAKDFGLNERVKNFH